MKKIVIALVAVAAVAGSVLGALLFFKNHPKEDSPAAADTDKVSPMADDDDADVSEQAELVLLLENNDFLPDEEGTSVLTVLYSGDITGAVTIKDEAGRTVCRLENDGSGSADAEFTVLTDEAKSGFLQAEADGVVSDPAAYYVVPEITREMADTLYDVGDDLSRFLTENDFSDPYGEKALNRLTAWLLSDERISAAGVNNGVLLFRTVDGLIGSYGMDRRESDDFVFGYTDKDAAYTRWRQGEDVSRTVIESQSAFTNDNIYHVSPFTGDSTVDAAMPFFIDQELRLADATGYSLGVFNGETALRGIQSGSIMDCGFLIFNTHGNQLRRSNGTFMLFSALGQVTREEMLGLLEDERGVGYRYLWGEMRQDEDGEIAGTDSLRMVYNLVPGGDGGEDLYQIWGSTRYFESVMGRHMFDNTVVYFIVCYGYSDPQLRQLLFNHGASAFIGCLQTLDVGLSAAVLEQLVQVMGGGRSGNNYGSLTRAMTSEFTDAAGEMANDILRACIDLKAERGFISDPDEVYAENRDSYIEAAETRPVLFTCGRNKDGRIFVEHSVLSGRVVDPEDKGIPDAEVTLYRWLDHNFVKETQVTTDANGRYEAELPIGIYGIMAEKESSASRAMQRGWVTVTLDVKDAEAEKIVLDLASLAGFVKDAETLEPLANASVQYTFGLTTSGVLTDEDGAFLIENLTPGEYTLRVTMNGYEDSDTYRLNLGYGSTTVLLDDILLKKKTEIPLRFSSNMGQYDGVIYTTGSALDVDGISIRTLPVSAPKYNYICSFLFYGERLYFCCKEAGTSDFSCALYSCDPDGGDMTLMREDVFEFYIENGRLYCWQTEYFDIETGSWKTDEEYSVPGFGSWWDDDGFRLDALEADGLAYIPITRQEDGTTKYGPGRRLLVPMDNSHYQIQIQTVADGMVFFTYWSGDSCMLYCCDIKTEKLTLLDQRMAAGSGTYFGW